MNIMGQYNEEEILNSFFGNKIDGVVVEIGAAFHDTNSNSRSLIERGWKALLVEPNKTFYKNLVDHYKESDNVFIENVCAFEDDIDEVSFYEYGQISTMDNCFKDRASELYVNEKWVDHNGEDKYGYIETKISAIKTSKLLEKYFTHIDFLSIDCEGADFDVILGIDFKTVSINLLCHEKQNENQEFRGIPDVNKQILEYLTSVGFVKVYENIGNIFFKNNNNNI